MGVIHRFPQVIPLALEPMYVYTPSPVPPVPAEQVKYKSGDRVVITKLMLKIQTIQQSNYKIAAAADIHPSTLSSYAHGKKSISAKHLISLCKLFECEPEDLMGTVTVEIK